MKTNKEVKPGDTFVRLSVLEQEGHVVALVNRPHVARNGRVVPTSEVNKTRRWWCYCDPELGGCDTIVSVREDLLLSGGTKSCGCLIHNSPNRRGKASPTVTVKGKEMTMKEAMKLCKVPYTEYLKRRKEGMSFEEAILTPPREKRRTYRGRYEVHGEMMSLSEAVRRYAKVSRQAVYLRLDAGMSIEDALGFERTDNKKNA